MLFPDPPRRRAAENIIPMINVVFLLLIFFLMTAELAPPDPLAVTPPHGAGAPAAPPAPVLSLGADGTIAYGGQTGAPALAAALAAVAAGPGPILLRADADAPATAAAGLLRRLAEAGAADVRIVTAP